MAAMHGPRKYVRLTDYLATLTEDAVTLTLSEIEQIIGAPLPASARATSFWTNSPTGVLTVRPWRRAGCWVVRTELRSVTPAVHFVRMVPETPASFFAG
ncbi:MAG: hypothetical protein AB7R89_11570 [Dehalococcoidia bacterium]